MRCGCSELPLIEELLHGFNPHFCGFYILHQGTAEATFKGSVTTRNITLESYGINSDFGGTATLTVEKDTVAERVTKPGTPGDENPPGLLPGKGNAGASVVILDMLDQGKETELSFVSVKSQ